MEEKASSEILSSVGETGTWEHEDTVLLSPWKHSAREDMTCMAL